MLSSFQVEILSELQRGKSSFPSLSSSTSCCLNNTTGSKFWELRNSRVIRIASCPNLPQNTWVVICVLLNSMDVILIYTSYMAAVNEVPCLLHSFQRVCMPTWSSTVNLLSGESSTGRRALRTLSDFLPKISAHAYYYHFYNLLLLPALLCITIKYLSFMTYNPHVT